MSRSSQPESHRPSRGAALRALAISLPLVFGLIAAAPALASTEEDYDPPNAGNPVRIVGYVLHPVGVIYDYLLLRPAWWVGSHQPFRTLFGRDD